MRDNERPMPERTARIMISMPGVPGVISAKQRAERRSHEKARRNLLTKIKCFLLTGEVVLHPILGALNKPSLRIVKKKYSSLPFAFTGILPLPGHSRFVKIYLIRQSLTAFCFSLRPPSSGYSCIRHYLLVPYGF